MEARGKNPDQVYEDALVRAGLRGNDNVPATAHAASAGTRRGDDPTEPCGPGRKTGRCARLARVGCPATVRGTSTLAS